VCQCVKNNTSASRFQPDGGGDTFLRKIGDHLLSKAGSCSHGEAMTQFRGGGTYFTLLLSVGPVITKMPTLRIIELYNRNK
jgi:hypothetical protein